MLVNSSSGDRNGSTSHARMQVAHGYGYGVPLYDARGSGRSQGSPNGYGYGWDWDRDVAGALDVLTRQPDVDPRRIGGLGLSTGADVLIAMAGADRRLGAIVADGATGGSFADMPPGFSLDRPTLWLMFKQVQLLSGTRPGPPLKTLVRTMSPTPLLLIAAGSIALERPMNAVYASAAREPSTRGTFLTSTTRPRFERCPNGTGNVCSATPTKHRSRDDALTSGSKQ